LTLAEQIALEPAPAPPLECCLNREVQCEHWLDFDRQVLLANLRGNLACAVREIVDLFARAREPLSSDELVAELRFAIGFGEIAPTEIPDFVVDLAIAEAIDPYLSGAIDHAAQ
jgi:hypothetical protein